MIKINKKYFITPLFLFILMTLFGYSSEEKPELIITNAQIASGINEKLMPVEIIDIFPAETSKVYCWFEWKNAEINTSITTKWYYITDNIHILDYAFSIPRKEGTGSVSLSMPEGKKLPVGEYKLEFKKDETTLKTIAFNVKEITAEPLQPTPPAAPVHSEENQQQHSTEDIH